MNRLDCIDHFVSGYIVFHHSPYAIGPVLACYATTPTVQMPHLPKRFPLESVHNDLDDKSINLSNLHAGVYFFSSRSTTDDDLQCK